MLAWSRSLVHHLDVHFMFSHYNYSFFFGSAEGWQYSSIVPILVEGVGQYLSINTAVLQY